jgi:glycosyltransferase involved in cell wall biosynthesis
MPTRIAFFGTYDAESHPRVAVLYEGLRASGVEIVECNRPIALSTADRVQLVRQPWRALLVAFQLLRIWGGLILDARRAAPVDAVIIGYLGHLDVHLARLLFRRTTLVLDHLIFLSDTATDRGVGGGWRDRVLTRVDQAALRAATIVVVDTDEHAGLMPSHLRHKALVVPVGAPLPWFHEPQVASDGPLRVVFFGLFTPLQGARVIAGAIARLSGRPDVQFTMIGSGQDLAEAQSIVGHDASVTWTSWAEPDALPKIVANHDVCLGIFDDGAKALRVVPNKVYQGAAAGCAVITSDTDPQRRALGAAGLFVPPCDAEALAAMIEGLADDRDALARAASAAHARAVSQYRPDSVVRPLLGVLGLRGSTD